MKRRGMLPATRQMSELIVEELSDEVLVYDQVTDRAHCLSLPAARVWRLCAEGRTYADAEALMGRAEIGSLLEQLAAVNLIARPTARRRVDHSRRRLMFQSAAVAGAAVLTIVAPSVAEAASCGKHLQVCCPSPPQCNPGHLCIGGFCN